MPEILSRPLRVVPPNHQNPMAGERPQRIHNAVLFERGEAQLQMPRGADRQVWDR
jgi:hypothetical protein